MAITSGIGHFVMAITSGVRNKAYNLLGVQTTIAGRLPRGGAAMTMTNANRRGRQFTPERLQQIRNLVERGKSREEIAELIGVTVGSLQVTCSKLQFHRSKPSSALREPA